MMPYLCPNGTSDSTKDEKIYDRLDPVRFFILSSPILLTEALMHLSVKDCWFSSITILGCSEESPSSFTSSKVGWMQPIAFILISQRQIVVEASDIWTCFVWNIQAKEGKPCSLVPPTPFPLYLAVWLYETTTPHTYIYSLVCKWTCYLFLELEGFLLAWKKGGQFLGDESREFHPSWLNDNKVRDGTVLLAETHGKGNQAQLLFQSCVIISLPLVLEGSGAIWRLQAVNVGLIFSSPFNPVWLRVSGQFENWFAICDALFLWYFGWFYMTFGLNWGVGQHSYLQHLKCK